MNPLYASYFLGMVWLRWYAGCVMGNVWKTAKSQELENV